MAIKIKTQRDYLVTEVTLESPVNADEVDELMRAMKANGKFVVVYGGGGHTGVSIEQRTRISENVAPQVRSLVGISEKVI